MTFLAPPLKGTNRRNTARPTIKVTTVGQELKLIFQIFLTKMPFVAVTQNNSSTCNRRRGKPVKNCKQVLFEMNSVGACFLNFHVSWLKDKYGVGVIVDYSRDYSVVNGV